MYDREYYCYWDGGRGGVAWACLIVGNKCEHSLFSLYPHVICSLHDTIHVCKLSAYL